MIFRKWGGGSKAVWNFSKVSSVLLGPGFPYLDIPNAYLDIPMLVFHPSIHGVVVAREGWKVGVHKPGGDIEAALRSLWWWLWPLISCKEGGHTPRWHRKLCNYSSHLVRWCFALVLPVFILIIMIYQHRKVLWEDKLSMGTMLSPTSVSSNPTQARPYQKHPRLVQTTKS